MVKEAVELFPESDNLFEFLSVHADMVYDSVRYNAYQKAINQVVKPGDVVVDVGTGTGLLAMLCAKAGAARVHAIEASPIILCAQRLAEANDLADRIIFHNNQSAGVEIGEKADVIVSELIGHMAFEEGVVEVLTDAKRRFLKMGGGMIPQTVTLFASPVYEPAVYARHIDQWYKPVRGFDFSLMFSLMRNLALKTPWVTDIDKSQLLAIPQSISVVDFIKNIKPVSIAHRKFPAARNGQVNGIAFWFETTLLPRIVLSSEPGTSTHWKQCFAPIPNPFTVTLGDIIEITTKMKFRTPEDNHFTFTWTAEIS